MIDEMTGRHLSEFEVVRELGWGGRGVGYEAVQTSLGRLVMVLVLYAGGLARSGPRHRVEFVSRWSARRSHRPK